MYSISFGTSNHGATTCSEQNHIKVTFVKKMNPHRRSLAAVLMKWTQPSFHWSLAGGKMRCNASLHTHLHTTRRGHDGRDDGRDRFGEESVPVARGR